MAQEKPRSERRVRRVRRTADTPAEKRKAGELSAEYIAEMLAHPRIDVSEEELRQQYSYVTKDLRSMSILAGLLFLVLIGLGVLQTLL